MKRMSPIGATVLIMTSGAAWGDGFENQAASMIDSFKERIVKISHQSPEAAHRRLSAEMAHLVEQSKPALVQVLVGKMTGSGFIVGPTGLVVTNGHVVGDASAVQIRFSDGGVLEGKVLASGQAGKRDLALVQLASGRRDWPTLPLGKSAVLKEGQRVVAMGFPMGLPFTAAAGIVSGLDHADMSIYVDYVQTDAAINPGNSGGPLVNMDGAVVGVNTQIVTKGGGSDGLGLSITSEDVRRALAQFERLGHLKLGRIGVVFGLKGQEGLEVKELEAASPAAAAGLLAGDMILKINGQPVSSYDEVARAVKRTAPGDAILLSVSRKGEVLEFSIKVAAED